MICDGDGTKQPAPLAREGCAEHDARTSISIDFITITVTSNFYRAFAFSMLLF